MPLEAVFCCGAVAEQLGSGLQNRVHRCESGPRLHVLHGVNLFFDLIIISEKSAYTRASGGIGRRKGFKIPRPYGCEGSNPSLPTSLR